MSDLWADRRQNSENEARLGAAREQAAAYRERTELQGKASYADRRTRARTDALQMALITYQAQEGTFSMDAVCELADRLAAYILEGSLTADTPPPPFSGKRL